MKKVFIIEDEAVLRDLFLEYFETAELGFEVIGSNGDGGEALRECIRLRPDLAIVDIRLPEVNGLEILHLLKTKVPETKVLIFTGNVTDHSLKTAIHGNADGFIEKSAGLEQVQLAIKSMFSGKTYYSPVIYQRILSLMPEHLAGIDSRVAVPG